MDISITTQKANYSKQKCMLCKDNPPTHRVLWNGGKNESWMCQNCFTPWYGENWQKITYFDKIGEDGIPKRYRIKRTVKEEKVKKDSLVYLEKAGYTGAMIALFVPPDIAKRLALKDGLPAEELHVTLAYLGETNELPDLEALKAFTQRMAAMHPPLSGTINGIGRFANTNDEGEQPFYASPDLPDLPKMRHCIMEGLEELGISCSKEHGFIPHITLKYIPEGQASPKVTLKESPVTFDALTLALGGVRFDYPLAGEVEKSLEVEIFKADERQIVYGVVLRVGQVDSQGDIITNEEEILNAAHTYMIESRKADLQHQETLPHSTAIAVESYLAPIDFELNGHQIKKSDWIVGMKVFDKDLWQSIKKGEINAFSIKGMGKRTPIG